MAWNGKDESLENMEERGFELHVGGRIVPGVYWTPKGSKAERLVLLGHGGTTHKKADYIMVVAGLLAGKGIASLAIDGPGHGDRTTEDLTQSPEKFEQAWTKDGGHDGMLEDWEAALNFIEAEKGARPTGWWGLSMGTMMGLPVTASDDRIKAALLGLMGSWGPNGDQLLALAPKVSCPVRFLVQWDDEIVPRDACLELFTAIGTSEKTLHGNPGIHTAIPPSEFIDSVNFLDEMLG